MLMTKVSEKRLNSFCRIEGPEELFEARSLQRNYQSHILSPSIALLSGYLMATKVGQSDQQEYKEKAYVCDWRPLLRNIKFYVIGIGEWQQIGG